MHVTGFDGKEYKFNYIKNRHRKNRDKKSSHHKSAASLINSLFPDLPVYEEVTLPGSKKLGRKSLLYADFFIPDLMLIVEVHGKQHYEYIPHFHKYDILNFIKSKSRDDDKIEWCTLNNIDIVVLPYDMKEEEWQILLTQARSRD